jgi:hypothetical protein
MSKDEPSEVQNNANLVEPTGQVTFQLLFALYDALKGLDPVLDIKLRAAIDNTVFMIENTNCINDSDFSEDPVWRLAQSFQASFSDD